ncbi:MAG TPA: ribosome biogenesis GTPase Der [Pirellulales bacterium]|jgi:GTP-binding protein|nr:ribosome biogenesis GTPase Der [Pirellulales bacterium]
MDAPTPEQRPAARVPTVVIVGRPNVGKSSLFNWLAGKRLAIVDDKPGVTRDRVSHLLHVDDRYFELFDTGGMGIEDVDNLTEHVEHQIQLAIDSAACVVLLVDARLGLAPLDQHVAERLRSLAVPVICVANKADAPSLDTQAHDFDRLGYGPVLPVSARENRGKEALLAAILERLPAPSAADAAPEEPLMKLAIVGRRNTGKSTFVNSLVHEERMITSEVPGTTRDSVDVRFELDGKAFIAIDTPGLRRNKSITTDIDFYSFHRAQRSIRRADVVFLFFDAAEPISRVDKQLCGYIDENYKPCIFVVNKWDLYAGQVATDDWAQYLRDTFRSMLHVPIVFITGQTGKNVKALVNHGQMLFKQARERVSTADLNRALRAIVDRNPPPLSKNRRVKIYYATQVGTEPPTIVLVCNEPGAVSDNYQRYLLGAFRDALPFAEVPIRLHLRQRKAAERGSGDNAIDVDTPDAATYGSTSELTDAE